MKLKPGVIFSNLDYWTKHAGEEYRLQQLKRCTHGDTSYEQQEIWLRRFFEHFVAARGRNVVRVLDYGCGFGRIANILCNNKNIEYFGFDISPAMTATFRADPPKPLQSNFDQRVRIAEQLNSAFTTAEKFDVILTVSVLIHNQPEAARAILAGMLERLAPGGKIVLIENPHTAVSAFENLWHGGCWCHSIPRYLEGRADLEIIDNFAGRHAIYIAQAFHEGRESRYTYHADAEQPGENIALQSILLRGLDRAVVNADHLMAEWSSTGLDHGTLVARVHDLEERLSTALEDASHAKEEAARAEEEAARAEENASRAIKEAARAEEEVSRARDDALRAKEEALRAKVEASQAKEDGSRAIGALSLATMRFSGRQRLLEDLAVAVNKTPKRFNEIGGDHSGQTPAPKAGDVIEWNAHRDTRYSHLFPGFEKVLHVFHHEWFGIRAAAGSLPGAKLAIPADRALPHERVLEIYDEIVRAPYERIIFHGLSNNSARVIEFLAQRGLGENLYLVKHGAPAQWSHPPERAAAFCALDLLQTGRVKRLHFMKEGFTYPVDGLFQPMLFNLSPNFGADNPVLRMKDLSREGVAFAPGWSGWRKNVYTNVLAAALAKRVTSVWVYARDIELPPLLSHKLKLQDHTTREATFELMAMSSICLNVSLVDCHPMVNIEAQSIGRPCLRGNLFLDALEKHPYIALTNITDLTSVVEIRDGVDRVLSVPEAELRGLTLDYQKRSDEVARSRYMEFLEL